MDHPASEPPPQGTTIIAKLANGREVQSFWDGTKYWCELGGRPKVVSWREFLTPPPVEKPMAMHFPHRALSTKELAEIEEMGRLQHQRKH